MAGSRRIVEGLPWYRCVRAISVPPLPDHNAMDGVSTRQLVDRSRFLVTESNSIYEWDQDSVTPADGFSVIAALDSITGRFILLSGDTAESFSAYDEFESSNSATNRYWLDWLIGAAGAGAAVTSLPGEVRHPGIIRMETGTTNAGRAQVQQLATARMLGGGMSTTLESMVRVPILNGGLEGFVVEFGFADTFSGIAGAEIFFGYDALSANWIAVTSDGIGITAVDTGVAVTTGFVKLTIRVADDNSAEFLINNVSVAVITTDLPLPPATFGVGYVIEKTAGVVSRFFEVDYFSVENVFFPSR